MSLAVLLTLPWLGLKPFFTRGEPREALVVQSMVETGNYILPRGYADAVPSKPPLLHWLAAISSAPASEVSEYSARLPSALAAIIFIVVMFRFVERRLSTQAAFISCLLLLSSIEWYRAMSVCRVDMLLSALLAAGLFYLFGWEERKLERLPLGGIFIFAAATLTKGPVSLALPAMIFGMYLWLCGYSLLKITKVLLVLFVPAALIASLWYFLAFTSGGEAFSAKVYYENVARFTGSMEDEPHAHSAFYLLATVILGMMPWTILLGGSFISDLRARRLRLDNVVKWFKSSEPIRVFSVLAIVAFLAFYSIPSSKRSVYLLPAYPFICILLGSYVSQLSESGARAIKFTTVVLAIITVVLACVLIVAQSSLPLMSKSPEITFYAQLLSDLSLTELGYRASFLLLPLIISGFILWWATNRSPQLGVGSAFGLVCAILLAIDSSLGPISAQALSAKPFAQELSGKLAKDQKLYSFESEFYDLSFYLKRAIYRVTDQVPLDGNIFLFESDLPDLQARLSSNQTIENLQKSSGSITKPGQHLVMVAVKSK